MSPWFLYVFISLCVYFFVLDVYRYFVSFISFFIFSLCSSFFLCLVMFVCTALFISWCYLVS